MFKILMNGNIVDTCKTYGQALAKAKKVKSLFCKNTFDVIIEDSLGRVLDRF